MFKIQEELEVGGPLTCLWADMVSPEVEANKEQIALLVQRTLALLGSASHSISLEEENYLGQDLIHAELKSLALEEYSDCKDKLFGPGFLETASKKMKMDKALGKVAAPPSNSRERRHPEECSDLCRILSKGTPSMVARDSSANPSCTTPTNTQSRAMD